MIPRRQPQHIVAAIRRDLYAKDPRCHWCGITTLKCTPSTVTHPDVATLDHVKSRWQCEKWEDYISPANHVLSCLECNQLRDRIDARREGLHEKRAEERQRAKDAVTGPAIERILRPSWTERWAG